MYLGLLDRWPTWREAVAKPVELILLDGVEQLPPLGRGKLDIALAVEDMFPVIETAPHPWLVAVPTQRPERNNDCCHFLPFVFSTKILTQLLKRKRPRLI